MAHSSNVYRYFDFDEHNLIYTGSYLIILCARSRVSILHFPQNTLFDTVKHIIGNEAIELEYNSMRYNAELSNTFEVDDLFCNKTQLVKEILFFLKRTHSLRNPACTCRPGIPKSRILDYGLNPTKECRQDQECSLLKSSSKIYTRHIENEIRISNIETQCFQNESVLSILHQSSLFSQDDDKTWKLKDTDRVHDIASLLSYVKKNRRGVEIDDTKIQYPELIEDVYSLNAKQQIFILKTNNRMYYNSIQEPKCDADIITLWRNAKTNTF